MWKNIGIEQCLSFINCQLRPEAKGNSIRPTVTISRMAGAGGRTVAAKLAEFLQASAPIECHWTVFDRNLVEKVLENQHLPKRIADYMPENHKPLLGDVLEELLGLHPASYTLVQRTTETIYRLAQMGYVILVGRGANVITREITTVFHVRLVGSLEKRVRRVQEVYDLARPAALEFIKTEDNGRRRYLKEHFRQDIDDPLLYHLVLNTDHIPYEDAARFIGNAVVHKFGLERREAALS